MSQNIPIEPLLLETLRLMQPVERKQCALFVQSPYFHQHIKNYSFTDLSALFDGCTQQLVAGKPFDKQTAWQFVYKDRVYVEATLNGMMSAVLGLVHRFLSLQRAQPFEKKQLLLHVAGFFRERQAENKFISAIEQLQQLHNQVANKDRIFLKFQYDIAYEQFEYLSLYNNKTDDLHLSLVSNALDQFYLLSKLELSYQLLQQQSLVPFDFEPLLDLQDILKLVPPVFFETEPLFDAYRQALLMVRAENGAAETHFSTLCNILQAHAASFSSKDNKTLHSALRNYCTYRYNRGDIPYLETLFAFYKSHLKEDYLLEQDGLPPAVMQNIVRVSLKLREYDWCKSFLEKREFPISGSRKPKEVYDFNLANLQFHLNDFDAAEALLNQDYSNSFYQLFKDSRYVLEAHQLDIKIGVEKNLDFDFLTDKLKAFRIKMVRKSKKEITEHHFLAVINFIKYTNKLLQLKQRLQLNTKKNAGLQTELESLKIEIASHQVVEREWLMDKCIALKAGV